MAEVYLNYTEHEATLARTFVSFFEREDFLDVVFVCKGNRRVKSNKLVLSTVSPFLKRIFAESKTTEEMMLSVPDVDHNILKLVFSFIYEGTMKLSKEELTHFKAILKLLDIKLPGAVIDEQLIHTLATSGPPPAVQIDMGKKLQYRVQRKNAPHNYNNVASTNPSTQVASSAVVQREESEKTTASNNNSLPEETNATQPSNTDGGSFTAEDDDPLNVPDYYFVPEASRNSTAQPQRSSANNDGPSEGTSQIASTPNPAVQQEGGSVGNHRPSASNSSKQKSGSSVRKRSHAQMADSDQNSVEKPVTIKVEQEEKETAAKKKPPVAHVQPLNVETANQRPKTRRS